MRVWASIPMAVSALQTNKLVQLTRKPGNAVPPVSAQDQAAGEKWLSALRPRSQALPRGS